MSETAEEPGPDYRMFDEGARRVLAIAAQTAVRSGADEVGARHLAMALADAAESSNRLSEWHVDPPSLSALPLTGDDIRRRFATPFGAADAPPAQVPFAADVHRVLVGVGAVADAHGDSHVGGEHLMVSLLMVSAEARDLFGVGGPGEVPPPSSFRPVDKRTVGARQQRRYAKKQTKKALRQLRRMQG